MIDLTVIVEEVVRGSVTARELRRKFMLPSLPRAGESLAFGGNQYKVVDVIHNIDKNPIVIEVVTRWSDYDFKTLSEDETWEKFYWQN